MRLSTLLFALSTSLALAACSASVNGGPSTVVPGDVPGTRLPRPNVAGAGTGANSLMRYVCRNSIPTGWIAVDYIDDTDACSTSRARHNAAVIVPLNKTAVGQTLEVCADQIIPRDWEQVQLIAGDARCPSSKPDPDVGKTTVRELRRLR